MIGSFASGAIASLVAKNGTKEFSQPFEYGFWCSRCLNDHIDVPDMIGSFASGAIAFLVAKNETKKKISTIVNKIIISGQISEFEVSKQLYWSSLHDGITCKWRHKLPGGQNWN